MRDNKHIDDFLDSKLRKSRVVSTTGDFTAMLMKKVQAEGKLAVEETKRDRVAKYIIGGFSAMIIGFTVFIAYLSGSEESSATETTGVNFSPAFHSSTNYFEKFTSFIESVFISLLDLVGLSANSKTVSITLTILGIVCMFLLAERYLIRGKFKSSVNLK